MPLLFAHYFEAKVGSGCCLNIQYSLVHIPPIPYDFTCEIDNHDDCSEERQLS